MSFGHYGERVDEGSEAFQAIYNHESIFYQRVAGSVDYAKVLNPIEHVILDGPLSSFGDDDNVFPAGADLFEALYDAIGRLPVMP